MIAIGVIITIITATGRDSLLQIGALLIVACLLHNSMGKVTTMGHAASIFGPMINITGSSLALWWGNNKPRQ